MGPQVVSLTAGLKKLSLTDEVIQGSLADLWGSNLVRILLKNQPRQFIVPYNTFKRQLPVSLTEKCNWNMFGYSTIDCLSCNLPES